MITSGIFSLDGGDYEVDNNVWIIGDDNEAIVIDAAHDHRPILERLDGRKLAGIICTHGHNDHINAAAALSDETGAPIYLHPEDSMLWEVVYGDRRVDNTLSNGDLITVGGSELQVLTPQDTPLAAAACTFRQRASSSAATRCLTAARAQRDVRFPAMT